MGRFLAKLAMVGLTGVVVFMTALLTGSVVAAVLVGFGLATAVVPALERE